MKKLPREIILTEYNPRWKDNFLFEERRIKEAFKNASSSDNLVDILHIGSTSVTGLVAKPIIDIIVVVKNSDLLDDVFSQAGYRYKGEYNIPMRKMYGKKEGYEVYLHLYEAGNHEISLNIMFRDYLNAHADAREAYANLKKTILEKDKSHSKLVATGITTYNLKKNDFIKNILDKAGFIELCMRLCTQNIEWESYYKIRNDCLSKIASIHEINVNDPHQKHIVLHAGTKVVAAAQLQLSPPNAFLEFSGFTDEVPSEAGKNFQFYLLVHIEKWIKKMNVMFLTTSVNLDDVAIYATNSYKIVNVKNHRVHMLKCLTEV